MELEDRLKYAKRALDGIALGDCFGQTFFVPDKEALQRIKDREILDGPWHFTDDTVMAIGIYRILEKYGEIRQDELARVFAENYALDWHRGYGGTEAFEKEIIGADTNKRVNAGLLTYPTLMAVDILIQKATKVPVGKDQLQHLELTRRFARRFNSFYGVDFFPEPTDFDLSGGAPIKVPGLDGSGKMGKSEGNCIYLVDDPKTLRKKVMRAVTDEGPQGPNSPMSEPVANLFTLLELTSAPEVVTQFRQAYADCSIRYGDLKKQLAEDILNITTPIRERVADMLADEAYISRVVRDGAEKARARAAETLAEMRSIMGIRKF